MLDESLQAGRRTYIVARHDELAAQVARRLVEADAAAVGPARLRCRLRLFQLLPRRRRAVLALRERQPGAQPRVLQVRARVAAASHAICGGCSMTCLIAHSVAELCVHEHANASKIGGQTAAGTFGRRRSAGAPCLPAGRGWVAAAARLTASAPCCRQMLVQIPLWQAADPAAFAALMTDASQVSSSCTV